MLGVNPATLRQWTRTGKLQAYRTPGGHRRFSAAEIASLSAARDGGAEERATQALIAQLRGRYRTLAQSPVAHQGWLASIDSDRRQRFHDLGDELLAQLGDYLCAGPGRARDRVLARAREVAAGYGQLTREMGVGTQDALEAYLLFRRPLLEVLSRTVAQHPEMSSRLGRIMRDAERFMDAVLVSVTGSTTVERASQP